jgi:hypothetical protein
MPFWSIVSLGIGCLAAFLLEGDLGGNTDHEPAPRELVIKLWDQKNASKMPVPVDLTVHRSGLVTEGIKAVRVDDEYFKKLLNRGMREGKSFKVYICLSISKPDSVLSDKLLEVLQRIRALKDPDADVEVMLMADEFKPKPIPKADDSKDK